MSTLNGRSCCPPSAAVHSQGAHPHGVDGRVTSGPLASGAVARCGARGLVRDLRGSQSPRLESCQLSRWHVVLQSLGLAISFRDRRLDLARPDGSGAAADRVPSGHVVGRALPVVQTCRHARCAFQLFVGDVGTDRGAVSPERQDEPGAISDPAFSSRLRWSSRDWCHAARRLETTPPASRVIELVSDSIAFHVIVSLSGVALMTAVAYYLTWTRALRSVSKSDRLRAV